MGYDDTHHSGYWLARSLKNTRRAKYARALRTGISLARLDRAWLLAGNAARDLSLVLRDSDLPEELE